MLTGDVAGKIWVPRLLAAAAGQPQTTFVPYALRSEYREPPYRCQGRHARYVIFQMAEVAVPRKLFAPILERIQRLRRSAVGVLPSG